MEEGNVMHVKNGEPGGKVLEEVSQICYNMPRKINKGTQSGEEESEGVGEVKGRRKSLIDI